MTNNCESVIANTGWGVCHRFIIGLCGMCTLTEASASLIVLIVAPLLACDLSLNASQTTALNAISTFGMALGAFMFGTIADSYGRKGSIPVTMAIAFCASITLSFAQNNFLINLSLFTLGLGLAGNNVVLRVYLIECLPLKRRGSSLALLDLFWIIGYLAALGISWLLVPSIVQMQRKRFRPNSWRVFVGLGNTPNLVVACIVSLLPESPRYLLYRKRKEEALNVLQQMYAINRSKHADTYSSSNLDDCIIENEDDDDPDDDSSNVVRKTRIFFMKMCKRIWELLGTPFRCTTILGILICLLHFPGFIWLALWNTHLLQEVEKDRLGKTLEGNSTCIVDVENMFLGFLHNCHDLNEDRFKFLSLLSLSYLLGEILLFAGIDLVGRKAFLVSSGIFGAAASCALYFIDNYTARLFFSSVFLASYAIGCTTTTTLLLENYPTRLRGTAIGFARILPFTVAAFAKLSWGMDCFLSVIIVSVSLLGTAIAGLPLLDLTRAPIRE